MAPLEPDTQSDALLQAISARVKHIEYLLDHGMDVDARRVLRKLSGVLPEPERRNVTATTFDRGGFSEMV